MTWQNRVKKPAFTSHSGTRVEFDFENVSAAVNKRDSIREFPDFNGAFVQNFGVGASSYPLLCVFWGNDHDKEADQFLNLLSEPGTGILEHPLYGRLENIVAFGPISRRDDLKTSANQTKFEVNFVQSSAFQFPGSLISPADQIEFDLAAFYTDQAEAFAAAIKIETANDKISLIDSVNAKIGAVKLALGAAAATVQEIENEFNDAIELIENNINTLVGDPLKLANQVINLIKLPSRAAASIGATLNAYGNLITATISDSQGLFTPSIGNSVNNQFYNSELFSNTAFAGMLEASSAVAESTQEVSGESLADFISPEPSEVPAFTKKSDIIESVNFLSVQFLALIEWNEANRASLDLLDTGEAYSFLNKAYSGMIGFLIQISFSARQERILVLGSRRNFLELCGELYGVIDNALDFFILTNDLSGDEILELPAGRSILYYV